MNDQQTEAGRIKSTLTQRSMPRLRFRAGGQDSSSAAITALANAEIPEHISDEDESRDGVGAVHVRGVLQEILEERVLLAFSGGESVEGRGEKSKNTRTRSAEMRSGRGSGGPLDSIDMKDDAEELSGFIEVRRRLCTFRQVALLSIFH